MKHIRGFKEDEEGVSGAVTATLIVATLTMVFAGIYAIAVPVWIQNAEANHMRQAASDFKNLKKNIESQIEQGDKPLTVSSPITLKADPTENFFGTEGVTLLGTLTVDPYSERFNLTNAANPDEVYGTCQGALYFQARNQQYAQQMYMYSNGAVVRIQEEAVEKGVILAAPDFDLEDEGGNRTLTYSTITLFGEPTTISGSKSVTVQTHTINALIALYEGGDWALGVNVTINVTSTLGYIKVYKSFYEETLDDLGFVAGTDYISTRIGDNLAIEIKNVNRINLYTATISIELR